jgi:magnesium transporter
MITTRAVPAPLPAHHRRVVTSPDTTNDFADPLRCQARTRLYRDGVLKLQGFPVADISEYRRVVLPMREVVNSLMRRDLHLVDGPIQPYYQDVYDHVLRATEWTESLRDLVTTILETNLTIQGNRMNVITKKVTSWAAIVAVPTFVTGFCRMNVPYPGFSRGRALAVSVTIMVAVAAALYVTFKRKDWL